MPKGCARSSPLPSASRFAQRGETPRQSDALPQRTTREAAPSPRSNHCRLIAPLSRGRLFSFNQVYFQSMGSIPCPAERTGMGYFLQHIIIESSQYAQPGDVAQTSIKP